MHIRSSLFALLTALVAALTIVGCEVVTDSTDIPYTPHLVVYGLISTDDSAVTVDVRRTLPLSQPYRDEDAWLRDAHVEIVADGNAYTLTHGDSAHYTVHGLTIEAGQQYTLRVDWNGLRTSATTTVPTAAPIDTGRYDLILDEFGYPQAKVWLMTHVPRPVALLGSYEYQRKLSTWDSIRMSQDPSYVPDTSWHTNGVWYQEISLATGGPVDSVGFHTYGSVYSDENYRAVLYTYDPSFYQFAHTYDRYYDDSPFGTGGNNPNWNMSDDGIGLFVGVAVTRRELLWQ